MQHCGLPGSVPYLLFVIHLLFSLTCQRVIFCRESNQRPTAQYCVLTRTHSKRKCKWPIYWATGFDYRLQQANAQSLANSETEIGSPVEHYKGTIFETSDSESIIQAAPPYKSIGKLPSGARLGDRFNWFSLTSPRFPYKVRAGILNRSCPTC